MHSFQPIDFYMLNESSDKFKNFGQKYSGHNKTNKQFTFKLKNQTSNSIGILNVCNKYFEFLQKNNLRLVGINTFYAFVNSGIYNFGSNGTSILLKNRSNNIQFYLGLEKILQSEEKYELGIGFALSMIGTIVFEPLVEGLLHNFSFQNNNDKMLTLLFFRIAEVYDISFNNGKHFSMYHITNNPILLYCFYSKYAFNSFKYSTRLEITPGDFYFKYRPSHGYIGSIGLRSVFGMQYMFSYFNFGAHVILGCRSFIHLLDLLFISKNTIHADDFLVVGFDFLLSYC